MSLKAVSAYIGALALIVGLAAFGTDLFGANRTFIIVVSIAVFIVCFILNEYARRQEPEEIQAKNNQLFRLSFGVLCEVGSVLFFFDYLTNTTNKPEWQIIPMLVFFVLGAFFLIRYFTNRVSGPRDPLGIRRK